MTMQIYLRSSLVVIGQLVEVFIVPFFILMNNVHTTEKICRHRKIL